MTHFEISELTDFVTGVLPIERAGVLQDHLATACGECEATCGFLRKVAAATAADKLWHVPAELVAAAEAVFAERFQSRPSLLSRILVRLIYDNVADFQPAGARAGQSVSRQLAFDAGDYYLDLSMGGDAMLHSLVGQFASKKTPGTPPANVPVLLFSGDTVISRTVTNDFGEFSLDYPPRKNLRLCLALEAQGSQIEVSLKEFQ